MKRTKLVLTGVAVMVMAFAAVGNAGEMGVGVMWQGDGVPQVLALPILMSPGLILEPMASFSKVSVDDPSGGTAGASSIGFEGTQFMFGARVEKAMNEDGPTGLFGGFANVGITSPDADGVDSWTDLSFGAYLGGSAPLADNVDIVGTWGVAFDIFGEHTAGDTVTQLGSTKIGTVANITLRWWVFGQ